jgi:hypothetical protein
VSVKVAARSHPVEGVLHGLAAEISEAQRRKILE